eukprot:gene30129-39326_t
MWAVQHGQMATVELLCARGANLDMKDDVRRSQCSVLGGELPAIWGFK